jgi:restriction endonuclease Mrr
LITIPAGVQVKHHRANVQRADIDRFIGALSGQFSQKIFITTVGYAPQAAQKAARADSRG